MPPLLREEEIDAVDSGNESDHDLISTETLKTFVIEVSLIRISIEEKHVRKYMIVLGKDNWNGKDR